MKNRFLFFLFFFFACANENFAQTDTLRTTISFNGSVAQTITVCATETPIALVGNIQSTTVNPYNGNVTWQTLGFGFFSAINNTQTTYTPDPDDLTAGFVNILLKPNCNCPRSYDTLKIIFRTPYSITNVAATAATRCDVCNGSFRLTLDGGVAPFTIVYKKNNSPNTTLTNQILNTTNQLVIGNLCEGNYQVINIIDANGCAVRNLGIASNITIEKPLSLALSTRGVTPVAATRCDVCNGSLLVGVQGGVAPFAANYLLNGVADTQNNLTLNATQQVSITNICNTSVTNIVITDANGCAMPLLAGAYAVAQPTPPAIGFDGLTVRDASTCSLCDGNLAIRIANNQTGTAPYTVRFDSAGIARVRNILQISSSNQIIISPLCPATYSNININDANGCNLQFTTVLAGPYIVNSPASPLIANVTTDNICGNASGKIKLLLSAMQRGTPPYRIILRKNINDSLIYNNLLAISDVITLNNVPPAIYTSIEIRDLNGCISTISGNYTIFTPIIYTKTVTGCQPNGSIQLVATGNGALTYDWNNTKVTATITNLDAGIYTVTITDPTANCTATTSAILQPCSSTRNETVLLNDSLTLCLPVGDLPQPVTSISFCGAPSIGQLTTNGSLTCVKYKSGTTQIGNTSTCVVQCNGQGLCDTTFINIGVIYPKPTKQTLIDTVGVGITKTNCVSVQELRSAPVTYNNICAAGANTSFINTTNCIKYKGLTVGVDTACYVICDQIGVCDTTILIVHTVPKTHAFDDIITVASQTTVVVPVLENDGFTGAPTLTVLRGTQDGELVLNSDNQLTFTSFANICRPIPPIYYRICAPSGCDSAYLYINIDCEAPKEFKIYTAVSPNGDGYNDVFFIQTITQYPNSELQIFNRWGGLVYEKIGYTNDWGGTYGGGYLPDATYFYTLILNDGSDKSYKGYLQIQR